MVYAASKIKNQALSWKISGTFWDLFNYFCYRFHFLSASWFFIRRILSFLFPAASVSSSNQDDLSWSNYVLIVLNIFRQRVQKSANFLLKIYKWISDFSDVIITVFEQLPLWINSLFCTREKFWVRFIAMFQIQVELHFLEERQINNTATYFWIMTIWNSKKKLEAKYIKRKR